MQSCACAGLKLKNKLYHVEHTTHVTSCRRLPVLRGSCVGSVSLGEANIKINFTSLPEYMCCGHGRVELYLCPSSGPHRSCNGITLPRYIRQEPRCGFVQLYTKLLHVSAFVGHRQRGLQQRETHEWLGYVKDM